MQIKLTSATQIMQVSQSAKVNKVMSDIVNVYNSKEYVV